jgi:hypothetical protein
MEVISQHLPGSTGGKTSVRTSGDQVEIQQKTRSPNTSQERYRCANLLSLDSRISLVSNVSGSTLKNHHQNHWLCGLWPSSGIINTRKNNVSGAGSVIASRRGKGDIYLVGSLRKS